MPVSPLSFAAAPAAPTTVAHGFSTRIGGVSTGVFHANNMHDKKGDSKENVTENRRRFLTALGLDPGGLFIVEQVHGIDILDVDELVPGQTVELEYDGLVTTRPGFTVGVTTADCLPVLLAAKNGRAVAALHAGWRGLAAGILARGIEAVCSRASCDPGDLWAAVGPGIASCCFEIGHEVVETFLANGFPEPFFHASASGRPHGDLPGMAAWNLTREGVVDVHQLGGCTFCEPGKYYSYRRDGWPNGLQLSVIGIRGDLQESTP